MNAFPAVFRSAGAPPGASTDGTNGYVNGTGRSFLGVLNRYAERCDGGAGGALTGGFGGNVNGRQLKEQRG